MIPSKSKSSESSAAHELLKELFPFTFVLDREQRITDLGALAERIFPALRRGDLLLEHFEYRAPPNGYVFGASSWHGKRPLIMSATAEPHTTMKGQAYYDGAYSLYYLWWPVVSDHEALSKLGVRLRDLPPHNSLSDVLMVLRNSMLSVEDAQMLLDVSRKKQAELAAANRKLIGETELVHARRAAEAASEAKSQFLSHMSHELRTPMNAIIGYTETLLAGYYGEIEPKSRGPLERIRINSRHLLDLVNKVLDISVIEAGYLELNVEEYDMASVVASALATTATLAEARGLTIETEVVGPLPKGLGDRMRVAEVLINLLHNAVKFTDEGFIRLTVDLVDANFRIRVLDSGRGIAPENILKIFKDFSKISLPDEMEAGAGLGLAIVDQIVKKHGGSISVQSEPGKGSCFTVLLPVRAVTLEAKAS
ncbi:MAG: ATP-binding protein [Gammaproteobacteria bacterium]